MALPSGAAEALFQAAKARSGELPEWAIRWAARIVAGRRGGRPAPGPILVRECVELAGEIFEVQTYAAARECGALQAIGGRHIERTVRAGTISKELGCLHRALNWASTFRRDGRPLIPGNPLRGVKSPTELNPLRPVATRERFDKLLERRPTFR
jgi:hypothetical protein